MPCLALPCLGARRGTWALIKPAPRVSPRPSVLGIPGGSAFVRPATLTCRAASSASVPSVANTDRSIALSPTLHENLSNSVLHPKADGMKVGFAAGGNGDRMSLVGRKRTYRRSDCRGQQPLHCCPWRRRLARQERAPSRRRARTTSSAALAGRRTRRRTAAGRRDKPRQEHRLGGHELRRWWSAALGPSGRRQAGLLLSTRNGLRRREAGGPTADARATAD
jgi:hypothetical protein